MGGFFMKKILVIINILLIVVSIVISCLIFSNREFKVNALKSVFEAFSNYINIGKSSTPVSSFNYFIYKANNKYYNVDYSIHSPTKGTVIDYDESSILIKCENSYFAYFDDVINVNVHILDVVDPSYCLANFIEDFTFYFYKGNNIYTYEEIMENY